MLVVSAGFKRIGSICIDSGGFDMFLLIWADFIWFQRFGRLGWIPIDFGIFEFGLVNLIGVVRFSFMDSSCLGGSGRFQYIRWDLWLGMGWLERLTIDSEDRFKLIFVGLGRFHWIRVKMATYLDGSGKIWMALSGFDWIWLDLGADSYGFLSSILLVWRDLIGL